LNPERETDQFRNQKNKGTLAWGYTSNLTYIEYGVKRNLFPNKRFAGKEAAPWQTLYDGKKPTALEWITEVVPSWSV